MALQASGPISFSQISNEFGSPSGKNLGAYRISQTVGDLTRPLDDGIPTSGTIQFSNFYSKRLNVVVYCSGNRITARSRYNDNNNVTVIGGYKTRPESSSGTKVWIYTNETIGSNIPASSAPNREYCSLITGGWEGGTDLRLDIGTSGVVSGAGGNGGSGAPATGVNGNNGLLGTSAIGVNYQPITITNRGRIQGGIGGGGGGGGANSFIRRRNSGGSSRAFASGGGGGGGQGFPGGSAGSAGNCNAGDGNWRLQSLSCSTSGASGDINANGSGGSGGTTVSFGGCVATGGNGGSAGNSGGNGSGNQYGGGGGAAGASGHGIIITNDGTGVTISNNGSITPQIVYNTGIS